MVARVHLRQRVKQFVYDKGSEILVDAALAAGVVSEGEADAAVQVVDDFVSGLQDPSGPVADAAELFLDLLGFVGPYIPDREALLKDVAEAFAVSPADLAAWLDSTEESAGGQ